MKTSDAGITLIKDFEGCRLKAYRDPIGVWTVGYGNLTAAYPDKVITQNEAQVLLLQDIKHAEDVVMRWVKKPVTQSMLDALISFVFNLGEGNLKKSTLLYKLNRGDYAGASMEFLRWNKAGGKALRGLTRRRIAERKLFLKDAYDFIHSTAVINA